MKYAYIVAVLILLVSIAGCGSNSQSSGGAAPKTPFLGGTEGLKIEFLKGSPPDEVTDTGTFDFQAVVSIKNNGEYNLKQDQVKLDIVGFLPEDFGVSQDQLSDIRPEDDPSPRQRDSEGNIIDAATTFVTFPDQDSFFNFEGSVTGNTEFTFKADACYKYQTKALSRICVLRDLSNVDTDDICDPSQSKTIYSSGSPVKVSAFRQNVAGKDKITFSFDITHSGTGKVFKEGDSTSQPAECPSDPRDTRERENRVFVTVDSGLPNLKCVGLNGATSGFVTLVTNKRSVTCTQELDPGRNDFETNVEITVDFNYKDSVEKKVLVKHLID